MSPDARARTLALLGLLSLPCCRVPPAPAGSHAAAGGEPSLARGAGLYDRHCAVCHGAEGRGDGVAARFLFPPARDFSAGRFRLVSAENGAPFDRDLVSTLRRGVPGSAMPSWSWLPEEDLRSLAAHVRALATRELTESLAEDGRQRGDPLLTAEAANIARARLTPDAPIVVPPEAQRAAASSERGRALYLGRCAQCHGADGAGKAEPRVDEDGTLNWARDFTAGFLKGGDTPTELLWRIRAGMPGSAMPPTELAPADEVALLGHLQSLIPAGSAARHVQARADLTVPRVPEAPELPDAGEWSAAVEIEVVLAPLWWHEHAVLGARLAALHDGRNLAVRLRWADATGEVLLFSEAQHSDGAALQLSGARQPALFGMGAPDEPTNLLHWQALRLDDVVSELALQDVRPHGSWPEAPGEVRADVPRYERLLGRITPSARVDRIVVAGVESIGAAARVRGGARAEARWQAGEWSVVFLRPLAAAAPDQVPLTPGSRAQIACAVWNGASGDGGARKSISIWQQLVLEP